MDLKGNKFDFGEMCRICLKSSAPLNNLFQADVPHMLKFCELLEVNICDDFPKNICGDCHGLLMQSYKLKQMCISSKLYFETLVQQHEVLPLNDSICLDINNPRRKEACKADGTDMDDFKDALLDQNSSREIGADCEEVQKRSSEVNCDKVLLPQSPQSSSKEEYPQAKFECHICYVKFEHEQDVSVHQSIHDDNRGACNVCKKIFSSIPILKRHIKTHMLVKSHTCQICSKSFVESYDLRKHTKRHHLGIPRVKKYKCTSCGQRFTDQYYLKVHQRKHTGEKPLECNLCAKSFYDPRSLRTHLDTHKGIKQYLCNYCGKSFLQNSHLRQHLIVHDQEKPYMCNTCNKRFTQSASLRRHQKVHS